MPAKYPSEDIIVAAYSILDFKADKTGKRDCTKQFQKALKSIAAIGGGTLFIPEGKYMIKGTINVPSSVTIRGDWHKPVKGKSIKGTILMAYSGRGKKDGTPFITLDFTSGIKDITIWYPEQNPDKITPYPFSIAHRSRNSTTVKNVTLVNSYQGIALGLLGSAPQHYFKNIYGTPLYIGIQLDRTFDIGRLENVRFSPDYWAESGLPGAPKKNSSYRDWMYKNGTGFLLYQSDWQYSAYVYLDGYKTGLVLRKGPGESGLPNGQFYNLNIRNCQYGIEAYQTKNHGMMFTRSSIKGDEYGVKVHQGFTGSLLFNTCTIAGKTSAIENNGAGQISLQNCYLYNPLNILGGNLIVMNTIFNFSSRHIVLGKKVGAAVVAANRFKTKPSIKNYSKSKNIVINHTQAAFAKLPKYTHIARKLTKPAKSHLYVVTDRKWGADNSGKKDTSAAIQKALAAAGKAGGGIVFLPGGRYLIKKQLIVPSGVELRGAHDVQHHSMAQSCIMLIKHGKGNAREPVAIILKARSGIRGLEFHYPDQGTTKITPYPFLMQGQGEKIYIMDLSATNPYQYIDLFTYKCDNHYLDYVAGNGLKTGIRVGGGSENGRIHNCHFNIHYWQRTAYPNIPRGNIKEMGSKGQIAWYYQMKNFNPFILGDCKNQVHFHNFVYGAHKGLALVKDKKGGPEGVVLGHGTDGSQISVYVEDTGPKGVSFINSQLVCMVTPDKKSHIVLSDKFNRSVTFFNSVLWGKADLSIDVAGGKLNLQQIDFKMGLTGDAIFNIKKAAVRIVNVFTDRNYIVIGSDKPGLITAMGGIYSGGLTHDVHKKYIEKNLKSVGKNTRLVDYLNVEKSGKSRKR